MGYNPTMDLEVFGEVWTGPHLVSRILSVSGTPWPAAFANPRSPAANSRWAALVHGFAQEPVRLHGVDQSLQLAPRLGSW